MINYGLCLLAMGIWIPGGTPNVEVIGMLVGDFFEKPFKNTQIADAMPKNTEFPIRLQKDMLYKNQGKKSVNLNNLITVWGTIFSSLLKTFWKIFVFTRYGKWADPEKRKNFISAQIFQKTLKYTKIRILYPKKYDEHTYHLAMEVPPPPGFEYGKL